ncbi:exodeoxyribonuclease V subunit beta [Mycobacterium palustre]|uniref:RecBCD enzyme subunit RecB n=1 Tax=Mycobacterium palustre TaxID=153971 RepID=A0A1X1Z1F6_9MYCO|nr:exodeoxyribonuclease V subunit beta [Mycobacterium palustre]MCV7100124.1 exodeoxyribonuclease V subunit beta [Mycobacterium palustre]ORW17182.1 exodeoxyribonuclease V subunit beta [Mycobacterium palustre]
MERFDLLGPLPASGSTTVLEASAGTGKTFALAGLVTRFIAEGVGKLDEMLLITFSKAASRELRERVRCQIVEAVAALEGSMPGRLTDLLAHLTAGTDAERGERCARLRDALSDFDAATICTTHQFCHLVLKSLGVAGDTDTDATLVESLDDLVAQIVDDLYLAHFGSQRDEVALSRRDALALARTIVEDPCAQLRPQHPDPQSVAAVRLRFATDVLDQLELRKRRLGIFSYNDLLSRLAGALKSPGGSADSAAADRMRRRWSIVMVDEFQDTDPIQWEVVDRAFNGHSRLVLIGDPKQAIYGFRGGDIYTYLRAAETAGERRTLSVNWRSDKALVDSLQTLLRGAALGDPNIVVHDVEARVGGHRLRGAPHNAPFRLRVVKRAAFGCEQDRTISIDRLRRHIPADLAADVAALLASGATFDGNPVRAGDVAVIVESGKDARACQTALTQAGIPAVYTGDGDVFAADAARDWLLLLDAFDQTHRAGLVRAAAATVFFGKTARDLAAGGDDLTDRIAATLRDWSDELRNRGPAAVFEAAQLAGMGRRVLAEQGGERTMTDLAHIAELLHAVAHRDRLTLPALRDWLRRQCEERAGAPERSRRIDSDAAAVQILTVWGAKGLQFPIVYLPFAFNRHVFIDDIPLYHDDDGVRCLYVGGPGGADRKRIEAFSRAEAARNDIRLTYVALTRAQSQVVAWWAPAKDEPNGGLSRLLRGRRLGEAEVPDSCVPPTISDEDALACLREWEAAGGPVIEESSVLDALAAHRPAPPGELAVRHFHASIDTTWRRTSYSALVRGAEESPDPGVGSEPEMTPRDDEIDDAALAVAPEAPAAGADVVSPMAELPAGATFGSLVHAVLETADPFAADLAAELEDHVRKHSAWWPVDAEPAAVAAALLPMHDTPLGPLAAGLTLRQIGLRDRLRELDFEIPLAGGDRRDAVSPVRLADLGALVREHLALDDPLASYSDRLLADALGGQSLRGYLSGSIDAVLRLPGQRYVVVDYKTNMLGATAADYGYPRLAEAMLHSDYPLQALLYTVVLHRFLRWRQPGYRPERHLGGVLYLFVRGMCGPHTPTVGGHPTGVFGWQPPAAMVTAVSDLLDGVRA